MSVAFDSKLDDIHARRWDGIERPYTQADVERAQDAGIGPGDIMPANIMETSTELADCWYRINADDDRRPITFAAAREGIDWDTTELPAGSYVIAGYTWWPPLNTWSSRPGVIKVVDDPDPAASAPALGISTTEQIVDLGETTTIEGCVSAEIGSTIQIPSPYTTGWPGPSNARIACSAELYGIGSGLPSGKSDGPQI